MFIEMEQNNSPVAIIYAEEGTPFITSPSAVLKDAPHPYAARLFQNYLFTVESQEMNIAVGGLRSVHPQAKEKAGRTPLKDIKLLKDDAEAMEKQVEEIKAKYTQFFGT
jgi:iron(III) transport system substrate-binding protein